MSLFLTVAFLIIFTVHLLFSDKSTVNSSEHKQQHNKQQHNKQQYHKQLEHNQYKHNKHNKQSDKYQIKQSDQTQKQNTDLLTQKLQSQPKCGKSTEQFHKDFFSFRDQTTLNSSMCVNPVDKIHNIGNCRSMKIKDIYDSIVAQ